MIKFVKMLDVFKKSFILIFLLVIFLLFYYSLPWMNQHFRRFSNSTYYLVEINETISNESKFEIILNGKLLVLEDFNNRTKSSVFKRLRKNFTVELNDTDIGTLYPISTEGKAKEFSLHAIFRPTITDIDRTLFLYVFQKFIDVCTENNITFFLYDGSLIGAYRHHGIIPWDDDIDVFVNSSQKELLAREGAKVPGFEVFTPKNFQWKFYHRKLSTSIDGKKFRWPYIDIFFWEVSSTHLYEYTNLRKGRSYKKEIVFPLSPRPFEGALLMCPYKTDAFLREKYNIDDCQTNTYSHLYESSNSWSHKVPCKKLENVYPFVKHLKEKICKENLVYKGKLIHSYTLRKC